MEDLGHEHCQSHKGEGNDTVRCVVARVASQESVAAVVVAVAVGGVRPVHASLGLVGAAAHPGHCLDAVSVADNRGEAGGGAGHRRHSRVNVHTVGARVAVFRMAKTKI